MDPKFNKWMHTCIAIYNIYNNYLSSLTCYADGNNFSCVGRSLCWWCPAKWDISPGYVSFFGCRRIVSSLEYRKLLVQQGCPSVSWMHWQLCYMLSSVAIEKNHSKPSIKRHVREGGSGGRGPNNGGTGGFFLKMKLHFWYWPFVDWNNQSVSLSSEFNQL